MAVKWRVPPAEAQSVTAALQELMVYTRAEPACTGCSLTTEMGPLVLIRYVETWAHERAMQRQIRTHRFASLLELVERATSEPVVEFVLPRRTLGLEYAEAVRGRSLVHE